MTYFLSGTWRPAESRPRPRWTSSTDRPATFCTPYSWEAKTHHHVPTQDKKEERFLFEAAAAAAASSSPESEGDDGAGLSLAHGDGNPLVLVHQVVFVRVAVNTHQRERPHKPQRYVS